MGMSALPLSLSQKKKKNTPPKKEKGIGARLLGSCRPLSLLSFPQSLLSLSVPHLRKSVFHLFLKDSLARAIKHEKNVLKLKKS